MKKGIAVVLAVLMMGAMLVGCGTDTSALEKQIEDLNKKIEKLEDNNKALEEENRKQQEEIDRANGKYDWDNPIDVKVDEFVSLFETDKDKFVNTYYNKVIRATVTIDYYTNHINANIGQIASITQNTKIWLIFNNSQYELDKQNLKNIEKTYIGVYNQVSRLLYLYDCRVA